MQCNHTLSICKQLLCSWFPAWPCCQLCCPNIIVLRVSILFCCCHLLMMLSFLFHWPILTLWMHDIWSRCPFLPYKPCSLWLLCTRHWQSYCGRLPVAFSMGGMRKWWEWEVDPCMWLLNTVRSELQPRVLEESWDQSCSVEGLMITVSICSCGSICRINWSMCVVLSSQSAPLVLLVLRDVTHLIVFFVCC